MRNPEYVFYLPNSDKLYVVARLGLPFGTHITGRGLNNVMLVYIGLL